MPITEMKRSLSLTKFLFPVVRPGFYFLILVCYIKKRKTNKQAKKYNQVLQHTLMMYYRLLHSLYQKGNKTQSLCFDAKRRKCHRFLYFQFDFFFFCLIFLLYSTVHLPRKERHQDFWILMQSPQLSGRYSQTKTAPVRFYFTLVRRAIITNASVIIPFDV